MDTKQLAKRLAVDSRDFCVACIVLPLIAFMLGMLAIHYPIPLLSLVIAGSCLGWIAFYRLLSRPDRELHGRIATVVSFGTLSLSSAFGSGMMVAGPGNYDVMALSISFVCGLLGALQYRRHQRESLAEQGSKDARR